jgi:hypothetical protein
MAKPQVISMEEFARKIGKTRSWVSLLVARKRIVPPPVRLFDKRNSPLLFRSNARVIKN